MLKPSQIYDFSIPTAESLSTFQDKILTWYYSYGRHYLWRNPSVSTYVRIVCEVLLQRTRAGTIEKFAPSFFRKYPSWKRLSSASDHQLQQSLKPIGLWRQRASSLSRLASSMYHRHGRFPKTRSEIESLPSVGQYIANAVLLFCYNQPEPLLDVNMARVLERHFGPRSLADIRYDPYLQSLAKKVVTCNDPIYMNWAILDLASIICTKSNPDHNICPVSQTCQYYLAFPTSC